MTPTGLPTVEDVIRLKGEGLEQFGGTFGDRPEDASCIDGAIGAALQAAYILSEDDRIDPLHLASYLLFYIARKNCFLDGNKRAGWMTATDFLLRNGLHVCASQDEVHALVLGIANGQIAKERVIEWMAGAGRLIPIPAHDEEGS